jgi:putative pyruvate formate lyase activating enzyme
VASWNLHFGEEEPLVGGRGSGTIFFAGCNLGCAFCQNFDISHHSSPSQEATAAELAAIMLDLKNQGAANINCVTPGHVVPQILEALVLAAKAGLDLPLVYNTGGYDALDTLALLAGIVDIYMPDVKFDSVENAAKYCQTMDYPETCRQALRAMHGQVGDLAIDPDTGLATRGLLVRHLVMPGGLAGTAAWMEFLAKDISPGTYVNLMDQYRPCGEAEHFPEIDRALTPGEYRQARDAARQAGITRLDERTDVHKLRLLRALMRQ